MRWTARLLPFVVLLVAAYAGWTHASDWPQWGGGPSRNMVAMAAGLLDSAKIQIGQDGEVDLAASTNVKWTAPLGSQAYGNPVVAGGRIYVGTNNERPHDPRHNGDRGVLLCLDEQSGKFIWQLVIPKLSGGQAVDFDGVGLCSSPATQGERVYLLTNRCEVLCLDAKGMANGNDGPFTDEASYFAPEGATPLEPGPTDADIIWRYDIYNELGVFPHQQAAGSVLLVGDRVYTTTANGVDWTNAHLPAPDAPALICLDKNTGKLLGEERSGISSRTLHCNWSSPAYGTTRDGRAIVVFGGGDGFCYAFEPEPVDGVLKEIWRYDCNPPQYKMNPKTNKPIKYGNSKGFSEICATPVIVDGKVYVATGQDPDSGDGVGNLSCIDASGSGDITQTGKVWAYDKIGRSLSTVSIADGLVYAADYAGKIYCLDANDGAEKWVHDTEGRIWGSALAADGKLYVGNEERMLHILTAGPEAKPISDIVLDGAVFSTPVVANGVMFITSDKTLFALQAKKQEKTAE